MPYVVFFLREFVIYLSVALVFCSVDLFWAAKKKSTKRENLLVKFISSDCSTQCRQDNGANMYVFTQLLQHTHKCKWIRLVADFEGVDVPHKYFPIGKKMKKKICDVGRFTAYVALNRNELGTTRSAAQQNLWQTKENENKTKIPTHIHTYNGWDARNARQKEKPTTTTTSPRTKREMRVKQIPIVTPSSLFSVFSLANCKWKHG